jgi:hypothetical protein
MQNQKITPTLKKIKKSELDTIGPNILLKNIKINLGFNKSFDSFDEQSEFYISFLKEDYENDNNNKDKEKENKDNENTEKKDNMNNNNNKINNNNNQNSSFNTEKNLVTNHDKQKRDIRNNHNNNVNNKNEIYNDKKYFKKSCFIRCISVNNNSSRKKRLKTDPVFNSYFSTLNNTKKSTNLSLKSLRLNDSLIKLRKKKLNGIINNNDKELKGNRSNIVVNTIRIKKNNNKRNKEVMNANNNKAINNICKCQIF